MFLAEVFTTVVYQPFFNILIFLYWALDQLSGGQPDMGVAVILLTLVIRLLLLPISLMGDKSEAERRAIATKARELQEKYSHDPVTLRKETKALFRNNPKVVVGELFSFGLQVSISLMLWRIFSTGLEGNDFHLIYPFTPRVDGAFNLVFLNRFDLSHPSFILNFLQSLLIFVFETLSVYTSVHPYTKKEIVRLQLTMPIMSFFIFMFLPAGKKLFVITTLGFSIVLMTFRYIKHRFEAYKFKVEEAEQRPPEESVLVETK
jgi:YidC/Oxa1 family membrane protein insertase